MFFSAPVMAVEPITGAFGVKLGDVWDGEATYTTEGDGYFQHIFIPESPLDAFGSYYVHVTPVKGLIFRIRAVKSETLCRIQFIALKQALSKKYGVGEGDSFQHIWTQGNRIIELECHSSADLSGFIDHLLSQKHG